MNGPILIQDHIDLTGAMANALFATANSKRRYQPADFMPRWDQSTAARRNRILEGFRRLEAMSKGDGQSPT